MTLQMPEWAKYRRVDECIECMDIRRETSQELLQAMPNAYGGELPGEDAWPEPDAARDADYKLSVIWKKLSDEARRDLIDAWGRR